jgi:hypothetical protein
MLFLRTVNNYKHFQAQCYSLDQVRRSLQPRSNEALSVYRVSAFSRLADRIAVLHGMTSMEHPKMLDYILLPSELLAAHDLVLQATDCDIEHPLLKEAHHEIFDLTDDKLEGLCVAIENASIAGKRLTKRAVRDLAKGEVTDPLHGAAAQALVSDRAGWDCLFVVADTE